jgi:hypothetical protein
MNIRKCGREVGHGPALPLMHAVLDLNDKRIAAPPLFQGMLGIPKAGGEVFEFLKENDVVSPA